MVSLYSTVRIAIGRWRHSRKYQKVYDQFQDLTMIPFPAYENNLRLAERVRHIPGCVVECGVWRGGMIAGIASLLGNERDYYLLDSFEGLPPAQDIDGEAALSWQKDTNSSNYFNNCTAEPEFAENAMRLAKVSSFHLIKGWFDQTLPNFISSPIALLRLDADWYDSTTICLESLFDQVAVGGLIILDDYYAWDGCSRALHDFLSRHSATERIQNLEGVCFLEKSSTSVRRHSIDDSEC